MAPQTLVTALICSPDGAVRLDPGALHGRSEIEGGLQLVTRREELSGDAQRHWVVWAAIELDAANQPLRYKGLAVSELWVDPARRLGYKSLAASVNRMAEAMRGGVNVQGLGAETRRLVKERLVAVGAPLWDRALEPLKRAFEKDTESR